VFVGNRLYFEIEGRRYPAVHGAAGEPTEGDDDPDDDGKALDGKITQIVRAQLKRELSKQTAGFGKMIEDALSKHSQAPKGEGKPGDDSAARLARLEAENAQLKRASLVKNADETVRGGLAGMGITGVKADIALAYLREKGRLVIDDAGEAKIVVARSRSKSAAVEEQEFDDIAAGLLDWAKSDEAAHFLPAPGSQRQAQTKPRPRPHPATQQHGEGPGFIADGEMLRRTREQLEAAGVDVFEAE
jgi:hypothetical protein